jgi:hypothetical protein
MKRTLLIISAALMGVATFAWAVSTWNYVKSFPCVSQVAANTTNLTAQTEESFSGDKANPYLMAVSVRASGTAATTNGSLTVYFQGSLDGVNYDTALLSPVKVSMTSLGAATNQVSDWFYLNGVQKLRVGAVANTFAGPVSNVTVVANIKVER